MRTLKKFLIAAGTLAMLGASAIAEAPKGTISIVVPYGPGGATDLVARAVAEGMQTALNNTVIVENKPGAFGITAIEYVGAAKDDGTTLLMHNITTGGLTPQLYKDRISFDSLTELRPVARIATIPGVYVASTKSNPAFTTPEEMVEWARTHPGELRVGNAGLNSIPHISSLLLELDTGITVNHIPATSGASGMTTDIINGDLHVAGLNLAAALNLKESGFGIPIMTSSPERLKQLPDVKSVAELGVRTVGSGNWQALFVRSSTPDSVVQSIREAVRAAVNNERVAEQLKNANTEIVYLDDEQELKAWYEAEMASLADALASVELAPEN